MNIRVLITRCSALGALILLAACAALPAPEPVDQQAMLEPWQEHRDKMMALRDWTLEGRVGARTGDEGANFSVYWQQHNEFYNIRISGPLGQGAATVSGGPGHAELRTADGVWTADSLDDLLAQTTELDMPLDLMQYWVRGIPSPRSPAGIRLNHVPVLERLEQEGWEVDYDQFHDDNMPRRLTIRQNDNYARIVIQSWDIPGV